MADTMHLCVSYIPLATKNRTMDPGTTMDAADKNAVQHISTLMEDGQALANAKGCLWLMDDDGRPVPVFLMERGKEVYDDLMVWCDQKPEDWFTLDIVAHDGHYAIALMPNVRKSWSRFRLARLMFHDEMLTENAYQTVFVPLFFVSHPTNTTFLALRDKIQSPVRLGILDVAEFDQNDPNASLDKVSYVGPVEWRQDDKVSKPYLEHMLED